MTEASTPLILEILPEGFYRFDSSWRFVEVNAEGERMLGRPRADVLGKVVWAEYPTLLGTPVESAYRCVATERIPVELEYFYEPWGKWFGAKVYAVPDGGIAVFFRDISERKRAESLQAGQLGVLEMIATGAPLPDVLAAVCRMIEGQEPGLLCSLLLTDGHNRRPERAVGPSLPDAFLRALEEIPISPPYLGSCYKALNSGQEVLETDIAADQRWSAEWRDLNLRHGLRACRSIPIVASDGPVRALVAIFRRAPGNPGPINKQLLDLASHLAGIAIERSRAVHALQASEQRYRTLFASMDEGFCVIKKVESEAGKPLDFRYVVANPAFAAQAGVGDVVGKTIRQVFPGEADEWFHTYDTVLRTGKAVRFERQLTTQGRMLELNAFAIEDEGQRLVAVLFKDISERKRAEARERRLLTEAATANAQFRAFFEQGALFAGIMHIDGAIIETNQLSLDACGYTRDQVVGKLFWECPWWSRSAELMEQIKAASVQAAAGKTYRAELPYFVADGSQRIVDLIVLPIKDNEGRVVFLAPTGTDVTDRKLAESKLRKSEERMRLLWEAAAVLLTTDDPDTMLRKLFAKIGPHLKLDTYFNFMVNETKDGLRLASCTGVSDDTARSIENLTLGQAICGTVALLRKPLAASFIQQSDDPKVQLIKGFGIRAYACNPLMAGDQLLGTLSFASRSRDEFATEELDFLQTICQYATAAYERLRLIRQLQESDRRKDEFLATLAHELRNPLAPLRNGLQVMKLAQGDGESAEQVRSMMERQLVHMVRLVDDLLDVSRISRGKITLRRQRIDVAKVVQQAVESSRPFVDASRQDLTVLLPSQPVFVDADMTRLAQVIANLLDNASKYTQPGGRITLKVERLGTEVVVSVRDTGIGIPSHMLPKVFDMFTQVDRSMERSQGGLGIGLSLVEGLVKMHGGSVEAKSDGPDMGSEFVVRLPIVQSGTKEQREQEVQTAPPAKPRRILVVDDNRDAASSLALLLRVMGNEAQMAHDGLEALDVAAAFNPDLVLLDIGMPKLNGYDTARRIREQPWGKNMVLVALTGWGRQDDRRKSQEAGFDSHLTKPADPAALEQLLAGFQPI